MRGTSVHAYLCYTKWTRNLSWCSRGAQKPIAVPVQYSLAGNWGVHANLIYKYQILYLDRITIVLWRHLVNDIDVCRSLKSPKKSIEPFILAFKVI